MDPTTLYTHLKIILLQCFQFSILNFNNNKFRSKMLLRSCPGREGMLLTLSFFFPLTKKQKYHRCPQNAQCDALIQVIKH